jgi:quercetin dioxygenase-like cupin family protein
MQSAISILIAAVLIAIPAATVVLDHPRVRVFRTTDASLTGVDRGPGVVIALDGGAGQTTGTAVWMDDVASRPALAPGGSWIIVQPRRVAAPMVPAPAPLPAPVPKPGEPPFTGITFNPLFENDRVRVVRARMDAGAREAFHTHAADTVLVHLSGGEIEDTANGKTIVNRWARGDVEFEARGSSHSARNLGKAVDVFLVALKP